jgi:hypothetical protein
MATIVRLASGWTLVVRDVNCGRVFGDVWEHVATSIVPSPESRETDFLHLSEAESLLEPTTRVVPISQTPAPGEI